ncbi:hypothetical protein CRENBAI_003897 [Crenichthys baileyi]|uniref:Uncharacterized protein n=1 Tax=Crenichthys baileyi TaxID=28760 RepID=A0AAV9SRB9_9TELE
MTQSSAVRAATFPVRGVIEVSVGGPIHFSGPLSSWAVIKPRGKGKDETTGLQELSAADEQPLTVMIFVKEEKIQKRSNTGLPLEQEEAILKLFLQTWEWDMVQNVTPWMLYLPG